MPRKKQITKCRAASGCGQKVLEGGCFCADHELLWIAKTGSTSERIRTKHAKMYKQFRSQQEREQNARITFSKEMWNRNINQQAARIHQQLDQQRKFIRANLDDLAKMIGENDVHGTTLRGSGEDHQADALKYLVQQDWFDGNDSSEHPRQAGSDRTVADESDRTAEEGQSEVPRVHVHRSV